MKKVLAYPTFGALLFALTVIWAPQAKAHNFTHATCFCKISCNDLTGQKHASAVIMDLTGAVNKAYHGVNSQKNKNQIDCETRCENKAGPYAGSQSILATACATCPLGQRVINAYSAVGTKAYRHAHLIGLLTKTPQVAGTPTCTCPSGWASNTTNVVGGVTPDGKCKRIACQPIGITPVPANGTSVGTWGFTWGNALYAWGTNANGGKAQCVTTGGTAAKCVWGAGKFAPIQKEPPLKPMFPKLRSLPK